MFQKEDGSTWRHLINPFQARQRAKFIEVKRRSGESREEANFAGNFSLLLISHILLLKPTFPRIRSPNKENKSISHLINRKLKIHLIIFYYLHLI